MREIVRGALVALGVGDALGMPTQYFPHELSAGRYGVLDDFFPGPEDNELKGAAAISYEPAGAPVTGIDISQA
ncbi:hypothetical protein [Paenarthrobacter sp. A20]|uniref:hypothetical protein n=1 Tax=Paenarthrobacter sp. A20 TaxID=2817891 RepID=UPI00209F15B9|nr:hypothetical protein [Paenarthrobacter sp. A20]MCP1415726.1 ADP-ribosylglycohydrolase [Paenarthrobacter sp. A20]